MATTTAAINTFRSLNASQPTEGITGSPTASFTIINQTTEDYYNYYDYPEEGFGVCVYERHGASFLPALYSIFFLLGLLGNSLVVWVITCGVRLRSMTDVCLLNLAVADLLLVCSLPFLAHQARDQWLFGDVMCKMVLGIYHIAFYCGIFFISLMSIDRYLAVVHAVYAMRARTRSFGMIAAAVTWVAGFFASFPDLIFLKQQQFNGSTSQFCLPEYSPPLSRETDYKGFHLAIADVRKQVENEKQEMQDKLRTSAKSKVLNERESWTNERQQLLDQNKALQKKLSFSIRDNKKLKSILQKAQEEIDFLCHQVSDLEKSTDEERIAWWTKRNKDHDEAEKEMKKRNELFNALHQGLLAQKEENERMRASIDDLKIALEQAKMICQALEEKQKSELAASENRFRKELLKSEKSFRKELSETQIEHGKEVFILNDAWEWKARQWEEEKEKLERSQSVRQRLWTQKEALRKEEIRRLKEQNPKHQVCCISLFFGLLQRI
ncbi:C-C chemokine receptor type 2 [Collichthys lucidus]|uniref:C-C chemokine receptor type 2 n=1 Tax=Collichthys lucidus TaxID=240159 RepID=A0A4U5V3N8_COLLU|nr:C-C chemokine receptor type 2 [Collichthys lucidus]